MINVWSTRSKKPKFILRGHTEIISDVKLTDCGKIVTSSYDWTVKVWDSKKGTLLRTLEGHQNGVVCVDVYQNKIVSGSMDQRVILWDLLTGHLLRVLTGHSSIVNVIRFNGARIFSGDFDGYLKIWDPENGNCLKTLKCHSMAVASIVIQENLVVTYSNQKRICIHNLTTGRCYHTVKTVQASPGKGQHLGNIFPLAYDKFSVKLWDISTRKVVRDLTAHTRLENHYGQICSIFITKCFVITSGVDGKVKLWDISTGHFIRDILELDNGGFVTNVTASETSLVGVKHLSNSPNYTEVICLNFSASTPTTATATAKTTEIVLRSKATKLSKLSLLETSRRKLRPRRTNKQN